jgi:hypothetical protein
MSQKFVSEIPVSYTRVSTVSQTLDQQSTALEAAGVTKTFSDTMSGARDDRPGLAAMIDYALEGDTRRGVEVRPPVPQHIANSVDRQGTNGSGRDAGVHH